MGRKFFSDIFYIFMISVFVLVLVSGWIKISAAYGRAKTAEMSRICAEDYNMSFQGYDGTYFYCFSALNGSIDIRRIQYIK